MPAVVHHPRKRPRPREQANELGAGTAVLRSSANNRRISKEKRQEKMKNIFPGLLFGCPCALATLS